MNNADVPPGGVPIPTGRYWPWNWSQEIRPEDRAAIYTDRGTANFTGSGTIDGYRNTLDRDLRSRAVVHPDMMEGLVRQQLWAGVDPGRAMTPAEYLQRAYAQTEDLRGTPADQRLDPDMIVDQVVRTLAGEQIEPTGSFVPTQYANELLNVLRRGAVYGDVDRLSLAQDYGEQQAAEDRVAMAAATGGPALDPGTAVADRNARYLNTQAVYDYARAMNDAAHRPDWANMPSTAFLGIGGLDSDNRYMFSQLANPFVNPMEARARVADYWRTRANSLNDPSGDTFALRTAPTMNPAVSTGRFLDMVPGFGGLEAIYPGGSSTNLAGFGQNVGGHQTGETPYGRLSRNIYNQVAVPTQSVFGMPFFLAARDNPHTGYQKGPMEQLGVMGPTRIGNQVAEFLNRTVPQIPQHMSREDYGDIARTFRAAEEANDNWKAAHYPLWQERSGVPQENRTHAPNWFRQAAAMPENVLGDPTTIGTVGVGGVVGGLWRGTAAGMLGKSPAVIAGAGLRGAGRGALRGLTSMMDYTDPAAETGLAYGVGATGGQNLLQWLNDRPDNEWRNPAAPNTTPQSNPEDIRRDIDRTWQKNRDSLGNAYRMWDENGRRPPASEYERAYKEWERSQRRR